MRKKLLVVGATGLVGTVLIDRCARDARLEVVALARRALPTRAGVEAIVADPADWSARIAALRPDILVSALGTTWRAAGRDEAAFRAVDEALVLAVARAAYAAGARQMIAVSSVGADAGARNLYLRVKGEVEAALAAVGFDRLDLIRPGLLRGARGGERRRGERLGIVAAPLTDALVSLAGQRRLRSIPATDVADAIATLAGQEAPGRFVHEHDALVRLARG